MGVGFIDPEPVEKVRPPRKQVLVVVTASWQVLCFDHNLGLMWEVAIEESLPANARLAEVRLCGCGSWSVRVRRSCSTTLHPATIPSSFPPFLPHYSTAS